MEIQLSYPFTAALPREEEPQPMQGSFIRHELFYTPQLSHHWVRIRADRGEWFQIDTTDNTLQIELLPAKRMQGGVPSYLAQRQQHINGHAATALSFSPADENQKAGIAVLQNEERFYYLCKSLEQGKPVVQLYQSGMGDDPQGMMLLASASLQDDRSLRLRIGAERTLYRFYFSEEQEGDNWQQLGEEQDARYLSTQNAGGFVGCTYGLWALTLKDESPNEVARYLWYEAGGNDAISGK